MTSQHTRMNAPRRMIRSAFTLIEMLTVIGILAILIVIILPAMGNARKAARLTDTRAQMSAIANAMSSFEMSERHRPGYFSPRYMASAINATTYGFTGMENAMLDLIGGYSTTAQAGLIPIGPGGTPGVDQVFVDVGAMGATKQASNGTIARSYLAFDSKHFVAQSAPGQRIAGNQNAQLPVFIDTFGQPILAWFADEIGDSETLFAAENNLSLASFYWATNAGFLSATKLGKLGEDQAVNSMIGTRGNANVTIDTKPFTARTASMMAMLANPAGTYRPPNPMPPPPATLVMPTVARSSIVLQAAGPDGIYLGCGDRGGKVASATAGVTDPRDPRNFIPFIPNRDPLSGGNFDDLVTGVGQ